MNHLDQLKQLKILTIKTGAIHEAQVLQLKNYPLVIPNISSVQISIDTEKHLVQYDLGFIKKPKKNKNMEKIMESITTWIQYILWDDTKVIFKTVNKNND